MMKDFIEDLIPLILDGDDHWWQCHLAALAMVSQGWLYYVRKRLYACPDVWTFRAMEKLAITLEEDEYLASLVKGISLQPSMGPEMGGAWKWVRMLLGLEGLKKIKFGGNIGMMADRYIRNIGNPEAVEEIEISGRKQMLWQAVVTWDETLTFGFPRLKKIRLSDVVLDVMVPTVGYPASFEELVLEDVSIVSGRMVEMLNGAKWMKCLHISSEGTNETELKEVLGSCVVECVHYEVRKATGRWNPLSGLTWECGRTVRCLHLGGHKVDAGILDTLRDVFRNLEELVVTGRLVKVTGGEWEELLSGGELPLLRRLGLPWGTNSPPFTRWNKQECEQIRVACEKRNIRLIYERGKVI